MDKSPQREANKESLTNEALSKRFKSTFDLVNYAIRRANKMIASGHAPRSNMDHELNIANAILDEIELGHDRLTPLDMDGIDLSGDSYEEIIAEMEEKA